MQDWLLLFKKASVSSRTMEGILNKFRLYIVPALKSLKLNEVSLLHLQKLLNDLTDRGIATDSVKRVRWLLKEFFNYLVEQSLVSKNPVDGVRISAKKQTLEDSGNYKAIRPEMREAFLKALDDNTVLKTLCYTMMFAGLRIGEALALKWRDVDFTENTLSINRAASRICTFDENGKVLSRKTIISDTKTAGSVRAVKMPALLADQVKSYFEERQLREIRHPDLSLTKADDLVFSTLDGKLRSYSGIRHTFDRFLKKHGLQDCGIHFHTLRHTFATILFEQEKDSRLIQSALGHKRSTTTDIYKNVSKSQLADLTEVFDRLYGTGISPFQPDERYDRLKSLLGDNPDQLLIRLEQLINQDKQS